MAAADPQRNGPEQSLEPSPPVSLVETSPPAPSPERNLDPPPFKPQPTLDDSAAGVSNEAVVQNASEEQPQPQPQNGLPTVAEPQPSTEDPDGGAVAKQEEAEDVLLPPEVDTVEVPSHWHPKPCVHVTSIGGPMQEEELLPLFNTLGQVSSISFENERQDAAVIRYESSSGEPDAVVTNVREALNNTKLGDRTLIVEPFRPDSFLFIGNLTRNIDDTLLCKMFEPHGKIERAFVLYNAEGQSKGYGFVEYSLKSQASSAKMAMGNINMDGRVLRVEWSDCRKIADMFSTVLFIDRISRENHDIEQSLRNLFGQYGKVRDCHLASGINQQFRGFAFVDFYHSLCADKAHQALDGHELDGSNIRVSFANPSKSALSYKMRFGPQAAQAALGFIGRGGFGDHMLQPLVPGMLMGASLRGGMAMPLLASRLMGSARPGMLGMGIGMQFGRGTLERGLVPPLLSSGTGMLGPGSVAAGMMGHAPLMVGNVAPRAGMAVGGNLLQGTGARLPAGQGAVPITSVAIAQVATAQAKAREEEAKARAEAAKQNYLKQATSEQQMTQQSFYQQQTLTGTDQQYKQPDSVYSYQQTYQQPAQQQTTLQSQYPAWTQQQQAGQQAQQTYNSQYYSQPDQNYLQQQQQGTQYSQHDGYYQQSSQQTQITGTQQQYGYAQQYNQQYGQQYGQQTSQNYGQMYGQTAQNGGQQYQQATPQQPQISYTQQSYPEQYAQQQQPQEQSQIGATPATATAAGAVVQDSSQQQAYASYYQQQAQQVVAQAGTGTSTASTTSPAQQSYEAQWAAYYANQAAYQQQASYGQQQAYSGTTGPATSYYEQTTSTDVNQKRSADQMESASQNQAGYNYQVAASGYSEQAGTGSTPYQQQAAATTTSYQQPASSAVSGYQQPGTTLSYQQPATSTPGYQQPAGTGSSGYDQSLSATSVADGYQQQPSAATGTFQAAASQSQTAVTGIFDYNKRPRY